MGIRSMTTRAFILIETAVGKAKQVANAIKQLEGVKSANSVTGPYDVIAIVEGQSLTDIGNLVTNSIHPIPGVSRTITCLVC